MALDTLVTGLVGLVGALIGGGVVVWAQFQQVGHERRVACRGLWLEAMQNIYALDHALASPSTTHVRLSDTVFTSSLGRVAPLFHGREPEILLDAFGTGFAAAKDALDAARDHPPASWDPENERRLCEARDRLGQLVPILIKRGQTRAWRRAEDRQLI
jgi:hypothetical protein